MYKRRGGCGAQHYPRVSVDHGVHGHGGGHHTPLKWVATVAQNVLPQYTKVSLKVRPH